MPGSGFLTGAKHLHAPNIAPRPSSGRFARLGRCKKAQDVQFVPAPGQPVAAAVSPRGNAVRCRYLGTACACNAQLLAAGVPWPSDGEMRMTHRCTVETLGEEPRGSAAWSRLWRNGWASMRAALACVEEGAILHACEHGESRTLEAYRNPLDDHLPEVVRELVLR